MIEMEKSSALSKPTCDYLKMRDNYLSNANEMIERKEWRKASELLWGAVTQTIKALASTSNVKIRTHEQFFDYIRDLGKEINDEEIYSLFLDLNALHKNFYDEIIPEKDFPFYHAKAEQFLRKLETIMARRVRELR